MPFARLLISGVGMRRMACFEPAGLYAHFKFTKLPKKPALL
jgi:hypothetical protein